MIKQRNIFEINKEQGVVSLIIVIFSALLLSVITVSFVTLMTKDQKQATNSDLSQSAYDSAQAGVEDAKRLLVKNQNCQLTGDTSADCTRIASVINSGSCDTVSSGLYNITGAENKVGDSALDQAYTCVKIKTDTPNYLGSASVDESVVVPLRGMSDFDRVEVSWFSDKDLSSAGPLNFDASGKNLPPVGANWPQNRPSLMRTQIIQPKTGTFSYQDLEDGTSTFFLYPVATGSQSISASLDLRLEVKSTQPTECVSTLVSGGYSCTMQIILKQPEPYGQQSYLHLTPLYNGAHFQVKLLNGSTAVNFNNIQPEIDSTGRANDLFRRVLSRVELNGGFTYPNAAVNVKNNLCKNFFVTDNAVNYQNSCTP